MRVLIAGGSGVIGKALNTHLSSKGMQVRVLSRSSENPIYRWHPAHHEMNALAIEEADIIINLAGANIAGALWTPAYKKTLKESRIQSTKTLIENLTKVSKKPRQFIQASGIGYYQDSPEWVTETDSSGNGFLAELTRVWEEEAAVVASDNTALTLLRFGVVLQKDEGFLAKTVPLARLGLMAGFGSGKQHMSWVHIDDLTALTAWVIEEEVAGVYNVVADIPASNKSINKAIARSLHRPYFLPNIPAKLLKIGMGELSSELLADHKVSNKKIQSKGFSFRFKDIDMAMSDLLDD